MQERKRVFTIYIRSTLDRVWKALTESADTQRYFFGRRIQSDWTVGSQFQLWDDGERGLDVEGEVLEADPPRRLVITWAVPWIEELRELPPARVTYEIEPDGESVRLTVIEEIPDEVPEKFLEGGKKGWPMILSSLKSWLETGEPLTYS